MDGVSVIGRNTQGVRLMNIDADDRVSAVAKIASEDVAEEEVAVAEEEAKKAPPRFPTFIAGEGRNRRWSRKRKATAGWSDRRGGRQLKPLPPILSLSRISGGDGEALLLLLDDERGEVHRASAGGVHYADLGMQTLLFTAKLDDRAEGRIASRIGIGADDFRFDASTDFWELGTAKKYTASSWTKPSSSRRSKSSKSPAWWTRPTFPALCYGLRTDFRGELFPAARPCWRGRLPVELKTSAVAACKRRWSSAFRPTRPSSVKDRKSRSAATNATCRSADAISSSPSGLASAPAG